MWSLEIAFGVASLLAMVLLANWYCREFREARAIEMILGDRDLLATVITTSLLSNPPVAVARFAKEPYWASVRAFQEADSVAHRRARSILRIAIALVLFGSGLAGVLSLGWFGLLLPAANIFIMHTTFVGSTRGIPDPSAMCRAAEHLQILGLIVHRWSSSEPGEASTWLREQPRLKVLCERVADL
jgi:hypothetical protein